jgi:multidrug efflux pump subunit AcrA (membrane-fusion protein)
MIEPGEEGQFFPSTGVEPGRPFVTRVRVSKEPPVRWDRGTVRVRFEVAPGADVPAGQTGSLKLASRVRNRLAIEKSAILEGPEGTYVLVASPDRRTLTKRPVEVGRHHAVYATIVSGLSEGEYALAKHTFVLDLERRLARRAPSITPRSQS